MTKKVNILQEILAMQRGQFVWLMQRQQREQRERQQLVTATVAAAAEEEKKEQQGIISQTISQTNLEDESTFLLRPENSLRVIVGPGVLRTKSSKLLL